MNDKLRQLLMRLLSQTRFEKFAWEYFPDENSIRTDVGKGLIRIRKRWTSYADEVLNDENTPFRFVVTLIDHRGRLTDTIDVDEHSQEEALATELFQFVSSQFREKKTGKLLDEMLAAIG